MQIKQNHDQPHLLLGFISLLPHAGNTQGSAYHEAEWQREKVPS